MKVIIITFCLIAAVFSKPISFSDVSESSELDSNTTEILSASQSLENPNTEPQSSEESASNQAETVSVSQQTENPSTDLKSSEENTSSQSLESESSESTSEETTSNQSISQSDEDDETDSAATGDSSQAPEENAQKVSAESNSQSDEDYAMGAMTETKDDSMDSEENVRKSVARVFASVMRVLSAEDNNSTEIKDQSNQVTEDNSSDSSDTTSNSADTSESTDTTSNTADTSETSDSSDVSESTEGSDSMATQQIKSQLCVNGTQSCESEEYFFQDVGDDAHESVHSLMMQEDYERDLSLRR